MTRNYKKKLIFDQSLKLLIERKIWSFG